MAETDDFQGHLSKSLVCLLMGMDDRSQHRIYASPCNAIPARVHRPRRSSVYRSMETSIGGRPVDLSVSTVN